MSETLLTVLMPVYNAEAHVKEAVQSVLDQTYSNFKLLAINDGCTDNSVKIIEAFNDPRIEILHLEKNGGLVNALNVGLQKIETKYIARTDADDICLPERFEMQVAFMEQHPNVGALGTGFDSLFDNGEIKKGTRFRPNHKSIRFKHLYQIHIIHGTSMLRTSVIKKHNLQFDPKFKHAEDYDFFDRLGDVSEIANLHESLYLIRQHEGRVSSQFSEIQWNNSSIVKQRILENMGVSATVHELELIMWMYYENYEWYNAEKAMELALLIDKLVATNTESNYMDPETLRFQLVSQFLHLINFQVTKGVKIGPILSKLKSLKFSDNPRLIFTIYLKSFLPG